MNFEWRIGSSFFPTTAARGHDDLLMGNSMKGLSFTPNLHSRHAPVTNAGV